MTLVGWAQIALVLALVLVTALPMSALIESVYAGKDNFLSPVLRPVERGFYLLAGVNEKREQSWFIYAIAMIAFSIAGFVSLFAIQRFQNLLPLNPQGFDAVPSDLAFNTSISFITNTNWQNYGGETTMSHLTQMIGLTVHNFLSAATGLAMAFALVRGFARSSSATVGNFWVDVTRVTLYLLLPIAVAGALVFVALGMPQTLAGAVDATTLEGAKQTISIGPVASQEIIKELGTNGGGFFNANSAHPFENPNPVTNLIELVAIFAIGAGLTNVLGRMVHDERQGWAIFAAMGLLFLAGVTTAYWSESHGNPAMAAFSVDSAPGGQQAGGNMEGKEVRFAPALSALWATVTTDTSCGAVNSMHDSYLPVGGMVPLVNMQLGEVIFGGVGSGLYGILAFAIVAMFVAGLMVGRTPEYLGKKLEAKEVKMTILALLSLPLSILGWTALAVVVPTGLAGIANAGPHGFTEILYAYTEGTGNNGSAFAGLSANTLFYNTTIAGAMLIGRFIFVIPLLAVAGSLAQKKLLAPSAGTFPTNRPLFVGLLMGVILIMGGLTYFPAISLGPAVEQVAMNQGKLFPAP